MTPKDRAIELAIEFCNEIDIVKPNKSSIKKAIICVNEIIEEVPNYRGMGNINPRSEYWQQVKQELEKL